MLDNTGPDQLQLVQSNEFLPRISLWATVGGLALVAIFASSVALSAVLNYKIAVKVSATVRPAGGLRLVQPAVAGTVEQINVKDNQLIKKGQVIARLNDTQLQIQKSQIQETLRQTQLQLDQVDAQIASLDIQSLAESNMLDNTLASAQAELGNSQRSYQDQRVITEADLAEAMAAVRVARAQRDRLLRGHELEATLDEAKAAVRVAKTQRDRLRQVVEAGAISRNYYEEKEQAVKSAEAKLAQTKAAAKKLSEEKQQMVEVAEAKLERAKAALNPNNAPVIVASERIGLERAKGKATLAALIKERETLLERRIQLRNQLDQGQKELEKIETNLRQTIVQAPIEGTLLQLQLRNPGQVIQPGEAVAYIAPAHSPLLIKAQIPSQEIDKVKVGQAVQMQVSACPYPDYGTLKGTVKTVAPDALPAASQGPTSSAAPGAYEVIIEPQAQFVGDEGDQCRLQAGMEGRADIISRQESVMKFILRKTKLIVDL